MDAAVLVIVFNRPWHTERVLEAVNEAGATRVYIASDGPRVDRPDDIKKIEEVRGLAGLLGPNTEVHMLSQNGNLGCGNAVKTAIDWFFSYEDEGIVLEDDTVPHQTFFPFCQKLLEKYRDDSRIGMISGTNHLPRASDSSYFFSRNKSCWGWATWKRAWKSMDFEMDWRRLPSAESVIKNMGPSYRQQAHWRSQLERIDLAEVDVWDWKWYFSMSAQNLLTIFPSVNLVANIGFGGDATHTKGPGRDVYLSTTEICFPLVPPRIFAPDYSWDKQFERSKMGLTLTKLLPKSFRRLLRAVRRLFGRGILPPIVKRN